MATVIFIDTSILLEILKAPGFANEPDAVVEEMRARIDAGDRLVMYGEWLLIRHRVRYDRLTSPFVGLDVIDLVSGQFHPIPERDAVLGRASVPPPPKLFRGQLGSLAAVEALMGPSAFGGEPAEGIMVRALMPDAAGPRIAKLLAAPAGTPTAQAPA
jgi:hypothetical protein